MTNQCERQAGVHAARGPRDTRHVDSAGRSILLARRNVYQAAAESMPTILTVQDLHKRFGNRIVLKGVSFAVGDRDRIGLIGANGSGKSTLLKMIVKGAGVSETEAALLEPDEGQIAIPNAGIPTMSTSRSSTSSSRRGSPGSACGCRGSVGFTGQRRRVG